MFDFDVYARISSICSANMNKFESHQLVVELWRLRDNIATATTIGDLAISLLLVHELLDEFPNAFINSSSDCLGNSLAAFFVILLHHLLETAKSRLEYHDRIKVGRQQLITNECSGAIRYSSIEDDGSLTYSIAKEGASFETDSSSSQLPLDPHLSKKAKLETPIQLPPEKEPTVIFKSKSRASRPNYPPAVKKYLKDWITSNVIINIISGRESIS